MGGMSDSHQKAVGKSNRLRKAGMTLSLIWLFLFLPGLVLGALWSGSMPLWPAITSGSEMDFILWLCTFVCSYGLPLLAGAFFVMGGKPRLR